MSEPVKNKTIDYKLDVIPKFATECYRCNAEYEYHVIFQDKQELLVCEVCCEIVKHWIDLKYDYKKISNI